MYSPPTPCFSMPGGRSKTSAASHLHLLSVTHVAEEVHHTGEDNEQNTTSGTQPQHLGQETLVQSWEALLPHDGAERRPCPVVLGYRAGDLGRVLDARLDDVHGCVEDGTDCATDSTRHEVIEDLALLVSCRGQQSADLED
jgi:hypothetical protein